MSLSQAASNADLSKETEGTTPVLSLSNVSKNFPGKKVLKSIDLQIAPGELVALVGNNGQGKTTLMKVILGLLIPDSGEVLINGESATSNRSIAQKSIFGYLPETTAFYPNLTGLETLHYFAVLKQEGRSKVLEVLKIVGLAQAAQYRVKTYSKGMKQRLGLAQALLGKPKLLLLDEPTNGLDPSGIHEFYQILGRLKNEGVAILMSSHLLAEIESRSDALALLKDGVISANGTVETLIRDAELSSIIKFHKGANFDVVRLDELLQLHTTEKIYSEHTDSFVLTCHPSHKQALLLSLLSADALISNLIVNDPGLEELFLQLNSGLEIT
ncbi:MAG: ABC transporter ATP-binding protein [Candidatus Polarisedimenticolaceae bacterium]|nr:ABC transporter ATP-binding protein [Candidatus Polarisedimenticolaceae bacterium]